MINMASNPSSNPSEASQVSCSTATDDTLSIVRQRISQPKDATVHFHLTLNGYIIKYLREKGSSASTEELLALARDNLSYLRRIDGSQYKPTFTRVFLGTLERCPAFRKEKDGWVVEETEVEAYKQDILRHIYRRLTRSIRRPFKTEERPALLPSVVVKLPPPQPLLPSPREYPEEEQPFKVAKVLGEFPGFQQMLLNLGVEPKYT